MSSDPFLAWILERIARERAADPDAPVYPVPHGEATVVPEEDLAFVRDLPADPTEPADLLSRVDRILGRHVANARTPRFMNQLFSGVHDESIAGYLAGLFTNDTLSTRVVAPAATDVERAVIRWLLRLLPWQGDGTDGTGTPSGSFSNYLAVFLARRRAQEAHGDEVVPRLALFTSETSHYSIAKGADLAGVPRANVFHVPAGSDHRVRPEDLAAAIAAARARGLLPFFVNATLGTTVAGILDPVTELAAVAKDGGAWFHVDAAWGGFELCGGRADHFRPGLEHADSLTWDAHKCAASPLALSFLLVRDGSSLSALRPPKGGGYLFQNLDDDGAEDADLGLTSLYCGKPFASLGMWLLWKSRGVSGIRAHVDRAWALTRRFRDWVDASPLFELVLEPETALVCFRPVPRDGGGAAESSALADGIRARAVADGRWLIRLCPFDGERVFRALFVNPLMTEQKVDELTALLESCHAEENA